MKLRYLAQGNFCKNLKSGFTLAEVLITLAVIGVVAAMSIPALLNSTNKQENVVALKKYSSTLSNALNLYMSNNGCSGNLRICLNLAANDHAGLFNIFKPYLNVQKDCGTVANAGCFGGATLIYKYLNNTTGGCLDTSTSAYKVQLTDGATMRLQLEDNACSQNSSKSGTDPLLHTCGWVDIDVNGLKAPNQYGRDLFQFFITSSGIYPKGMPGDTAYSDANEKPGCDPASANISSSPYEGRGHGCTAKVLQEGAINY